MDAETRDALNYLARVGALYANTMHPDMRKALDRVMAVAADREHSDEFVVLFCGWARVRLPELKGTDVRCLLDAWYTFKQEMGKTPPYEPEVH